MVHAVVKDEEGQAEDPEGVVGSQFAVPHVDVEFLGEAVHRQRGELSGGRVDVGEVVARVVEVAAAGQDKAATGTNPRRQRGSEAGLRYRESDADVPTALVTICGVDTDVDRLVGVRVRPDPAPYR